MPNQEEPEGEVNRARLLPLLREKASAKPTDEG